MIRFRAFENRLLFAAAVAAFAISGWLAGLPQEATAAPKAGLLDLTFGENGKTVTGGGPVAVASSPTDILGLDDGSTISLEANDRTRQSGLVKRGPGGQPDPAFGDGGTALLPLVEGFDMRGYRVVSQGDWFIVVSAATTDTDQTLAVQRFDRDTGQLDSDFGDGGVAAFGPSEIIGNSLNNRLDPFGLAVDGSGRIYVGASPSYWDAPDLLFRLTTEGALDQSFGDAGVISVNLPRAQCLPFERLTVTPEGAYLYSNNCIRRYDASGDLDFERKYANQGGSLTTILRSPAGQTYVAVGDDSDLIRRVLKLDGAGNISPAFGINGSLPSYPEAPDLAVKFIQFDSEGRFLMAGRPESRVEDEYEPEDMRQAFLRLNPDGSPDAEFGADGLLILDSPTGRRNEARDLTTTPDSIILVASSYFTGLTARKLDQDGQPDDGFGDNGLLEFRAAFPAEDEIFETLTVRGGSTLAGGRSGGRALLLMLGPNGKRDKGFGTGGTLTLPQIVPGSTDTVRYLNGTASGDFIACIDGPAGVTVARITPAGELDGNFGLGGLSHLANLTACAGIFEANRRILIAGEYAGQALAVIRLMADGVWDQGYGDGGWAFLETIGPAFFGNNTSYAPFAFTGLPDGTAIYAFRGSLGKINRNGDPETRFSGDGLVPLPGGERSTPMTYPTAIGLDRKGMIYVGGHDRRRSIVFKLNPKGKPVRDFGKRGTRVIETAGLKAPMTDLKVQSDGRVLISAPGRKFRCLNDCESLLAFRLKRNGKLDRGFAGKGKFTRRFGLGSVARSLSISSRGVVLGGTARTGSEGSEALVIRLTR